MLPEDAASIETSDVGTPFDDPPPELGALPGDRAIEPYVGRPLPVVYGLAPRVTAEDVPLLLGTAVDSDAISLSVPEGAPSIAITLVATHGTLSLATTSGLWFGEGDQVGSTIMTFVGGADDINAALEGLTFTPAADYFGDAGICLDISYAPQSSEFPSLCVNRVEAANPAANVGPRTAVSMLITVTPVNDAPMISPIADQVSEQNKSVGPIAIAVADVDGPRNALTVRVRSSDETLVPNQRLSLRGTGANRLLTIAPRANTAGTAVITVTASDELTTTTRSFTLNVLGDPVVTHVTLGPPPPVR